MDGTKLATAGACRMMDASVISDPAGLHPSPRTTDRAPPVCSLWCSLRRPGPFETPDCPFAKNAHHDVLMMDGVLPRKQRLRKPRCECVLSLFLHAEHRRGEHHMPRTPIDCAGLHLCPRGAQGPTRAHELNDAADRFRSQRVKKFPPGESRKLNLDHLIGFQVDSCGVQVLELIERAVLAVWK